MKEYLRITFPRLENKFHPKGIVEIVEDLQSICNDVKYNLKISDSIKKGNFWGFSLIVNIDTEKREIFLSYNARSKHHSAGDLRSGGFGDIYGWSGLVAANIVHYIHDNEKDEVKYVISCSSTPVESITPIPDVLEVSRYSRSGFFNRLRGNSYDGISLSLDAIEKFISKKKNYVFLALTNTISSYLGPTNGRNIGVNFLREEYFKEIFGITLDQLRENVPNLPYITKEKVIENLQIFKNNNRVLVNNLSYNNDSFYETCDLNYRLASIMLESLPLDRCLFQVVPFHYGNNNYPKFSCFHFKPNMRYSKRGVIGKIRAFEIEEEKNPFKLNKYEVILKDNKIKLVKK